MKDDWKRKAACRGKTHLFFPPRREREAARLVREAEAFTVCAACPVRSECRAAAYGEFGVWDGQPTDYFYVPGVKDVSM